MEKRQPTLRFPEFKEDWMRYKLEDLSEKIGDGLHGTPIYVDDSDVFFINGNNLIDGKIVVNENSKKVSIKTYQKNNKGLNKNSILISVNGTIGNISRYNNEKIMLGKSIGYFNFKQSKDFYFHILQTTLVQNYFKSELTGSTIKNLSLKTLRETIIFQPSIKEQIKIANFLSAVDEKITLLKEKKDALETYKKGIMQKIFNQELRFKQDNGNEFPDWEEKSLGDIGNTYNGLTGKTKEDFGIGKPYIQYKQIFDNSKINIEKCELVDITSYDNQNLVQFGDVFFTVSSETPNEIGTASVLLDEVKEMYLNSFCFGYRANSLNELVPEFSRYLFRNELFRNDIVKLAQGSTRYNMSKVSLMKINILLPCKEEQTKIANFLSAIDEKINLVTTQIEDTQEYKKGLLQQMFC